MHPKNQTQAPQFPSGPAAHRTRCSIPCDTVSLPTAHKATARCCATQLCAHLQGPRAPSTSACVSLSRLCAQCPRSACGTMAKGCAMLCRWMWSVLLKRLLDADVWWPQLGGSSSPLVSGICGIPCRKGSVHTVFLESPHRGMGPVGCSCVSVRGCSCARARACAFGCGRALAG